MSNHATVHGFNSSFPVLESIMTTDQGACKNPDNIECPIPFGIMAVTSYEWVLVGLSLGVQNKFLLSTPLSIAYSHEVVELNEYCLRNQV